MAKRPAGKPRRAPLKKPVAARAVVTSTAPTARGASNELTQLLADIEQRRGEQRYIPGVGPKRIGSILAQTIARSGFAQQTVAAEIVAAWQAAVDSKLLKFTRVGQVRRGTLQITVANSVIMQELTFRKTELLAQLAQRAASHNIKSIRFRTGNVED